MTDSQKKCIECNGKGTLVRLGGDWGKTPDTTVPCWNCKGLGHIIVRTIVEPRTTFTKEQLLQVLKDAGINVKRF